MELPSQSRFGPAVLISGGLLAPGGVQTHLEYLIRLLIKNEVRVVVAASGTQWKPEAIDALAALGCRFLMPPRFLLRWRRIAQIWSVILWVIRLWHRRFASVYCIGGGRSHLFFKSLVGSNVPTLYHEIVEAPSPDSCEEILAATLTAIVANSHKVAVAMQVSHPLARIEVIPFLTTDRFVSTFSGVSSPPTDSEPLRFVFLGRLVDHKRPDQLIYHWRELTAMPFVGPANLDLYGYDLSGDMIGILREYVHAQKLGSEIRIHGAYDFSKVDTCLSDKHVLVLPSLYEGLPLVLIEAMQRGIPIVACDSGGTAELAKDNPDVTITSTDWDDFARGFCEMAGKVRAGAIDKERLRIWTDSRYGYAVVSQKWLEALLNPKEFFGLDNPNQS